MSGTTTTPTDYIMALQQQRQGMGGGMARPMGMPAPAMPTGAGSVPVPVGQQIAQAGQGIGGLLGGLSGQQANNDYGSIGGGPMLGVTGLLGGPIGLAATGLNLARRGYNVVNTNNQLDQAGLNPLSFGQSLGALLGLNGYAGGNVGTERAIAQQGFQPGFSPMSPGGNASMQMPGFDGGGSAPLSLGAQVGSLQSSSPQSSPNGGMAGGLGMASGPDFGQHGDDAS